MYDCLLLCGSFTTTCQTHATIQTLIMRDCTLPKKVLWKSSYGLIFYVNKLQIEFLEAITQTRADSCHQSSGVTIPYYSRVHCCLGKIQRGSICLRDSINFTISEWRYILFVRTSVMKLNHKMFYSSLLLNFS